MLGGGDASADRAPLDLERGTTLEEPGLQAPVDTGCAQ